MSDNRHAIGAKESFIPSLGEKIWSAPSEAHYDAYIFRTPRGVSVGYIRIPHYMGDKEEVGEFCEVIERFEKSTKVLVIDQINNPGGSVFYLYALAAALTDKQLETPKHHIILTQEEVYAALSIREQLEGVETVQQAIEILGETIGGYPVSMETVALFRTFSQFVLDEWQAGKLYTDPIFLFGFDKISPHPTAHYTKPILLLVNSLDFSGGDFFPAILQDNNRATILGTRTAGAGGYVTQTTYPNQTGIADFSLTGSLAKRLNREPIENLGITPDIEYALTPYDLQHNYAEYKAKILETVDALVRTR